MKKYKLYQVDSFTTTLFKGNPAGVVLNADGLSDNDMQNIARELNNSETAFFFKSNEPDCDGELRYFTPKTEVPTCGHATIAAMYVYAVTNQLDDCILKIKTKVGILPMKIARNGQSYKITMTQGKFEILGDLTEANKDKLLDALSLTKTDLNDKCPIQIVSTGHSKVMIGLHSKSKMNDIIPNNEKLIELSHCIKCNGFFVFTFDTDKKGILTEGRMFAPAIGINEDPVTGNANGPLGGYLLANKIITNNEEVYKFLGFQGEKINRPGQVEVQVHYKKGDPQIVEISGEATIVFETEISLL